MRLRFLRWRTNPRCRRLKSGLRCDWCVSWCVTPLANCRSSAPSAATDATDATDAASADTVCDSLIMHDLRRPDTAGFPIAAEPDFGRITLRGVSRVFDGGVEAVRALDLDIARGEF